MLRDDVMKIEFGMIVLLIWTYSVLQLPPEMFIQELTFVVLCVVVGILPIKVLLLVAGSLVLLFVKISASEEDQVGTRLLTIAVVINTAWIIFGLSVLYCMNLILVEGKFGQSQPEAFQTLGVISLISGAAHLILFLTLFFRSSSSD